jgi:hypothetical protein
MSSVLNIAHDLEILLVPVERIFWTPLFLLFSFMQLHQQPKQLASITD